MATPSSPSPLPRWPVPRRRRRTPTWEEVPQEEEKEEEDEAEEVEAAGRVRWLVAVGVMMAWGRCLLCRVLSMEAVLG